MNKAPIAILLSLLFVGTVARAAEVTELPHTAVPLTESEVRSLYEGKTETTKLVRKGEPRFELKTYYSADKKIIGYYNDFILPTRGDYVDGSWNVTGNKMCVESNQHHVANEIIKETTCKTLFKVGTQIWIGTPADGTSGDPSASKSTYEKFDGVRSRLTNGNSAQQGFLEMQKSVENNFEN